MFKKNLSTRNLVLVTIAVCLAVVILVGLVWSLAAPLSMGSLLYSVGLKKPSARLTLIGAQRSEKIEDYYNALVRATDGKSYKIVTFAAEKMLLRSGDDVLFDNDKYDAFTKKIDKQLESNTQSTDQFIKCSLVYAKMRLNKGVDDGNILFNQAKGYCKGSSIYYYYNLSNSIRSYINAVIDCKKDVKATAYNVLVQMRQLDEAETSANYKYWRTSTKNSMESGTDYVSAQEYMAQDVSALIKAFDITEQSAKAYAEANGTYFYNAYLYWTEAIAKYDKAN